MFTSSETLSVGPEDISVMVQRADTHEAILDATVDLYFTPPPGVAMSAVDPFCRADTAPTKSNSISGSRAIRATHERATNKLLYATAVTLPGAGLWKMRVSIHNRNADTNLECTLPVVAHRTASSSIWTGLMIPPVLTGLFAAHQRLRRGQASGRRRG